ncbi:MULTISPECIES: dimethylglycine demethylation protein DgcB [Pseudomonas]|jgi:Fe-S oxidoreductase|uniref:Dimethylglycine demethylation protein DgcB n=1 Tax=Pseudomonas veronii TaxID=76761 RepID=A0ABS0VEQ2_PSEVE|nr:MULTISPECIES: dimethylglycine demethylation protein DgcB [Pseudomonas]MBI6551376.1 dimethylglycine demethylation protein DgcB [Pseudomonas veronii]MBI6649604.1 dimethylglycine demethylation protein DgcB [Pseudomonas veronii]MCT8962394.1 dimethylglycine demethylation protein DgcB [Pseudomonas veronii]MCT9827895.1 dimethylglycine demethylation protein DgcB [Pseudomonas veronii]RTY71810.1 dimethylglycine demethylation protein DgcB [Pseudomonas veronii]
MLNTLLPILLFAALGLAVLGALRRAAMWRRGRASKVDLIKGLLAMPKRYMVDLHHVVARDKYIANTHVATALGFVLSALLAVLVHGFGLHNRILGVALLLASVLMFVGATFVYLRRRNPPSRLSKGPWMRLPKSLMAFSVSFFLVTLPVAGVLPADFGGWLLAALLSVGVLWGVSEMFFGMTWGGPMKHAFAGALHLAWHRRAERFGGGRSTGLKPLDLNDKSAPLGVEKPKDFTWNQLLGFDACVQCGKCEAACPAFAAGQPLNPKKLIQDMVVGLAGGTDAKFAGSAYPGKPIGEHRGNPHQPIVNGLVDADTLWSCTTCRACVEECPMMIEHVDAIVDMRRHLTLEKGATPNKGAEVLENLIATDNPGGFAPGGRLNWAADLNLPLLSEKGRCEVLFWVGDGAFDMRNQRTLRAFVKVLKAAKVDFAVLGLEERDSGDVARRLGDEATFQLLATRNIQTLAKYNFTRIVTCDPHSFHVLKNEYGAFNGDYVVQHHSTFMAELIGDGALNLGQHKGSSVTYHDPCYLGRYNGEYEAPRQVLRALGIEVKEMQRSGYRSRCCGGGGGAPITDIPGKQRIPDMRMDDIRTTGAELVAVGCPQCTAMLEGVVEPRPLIKDIAELVADALLDEPAPAKAPITREPAEVH